MFPNNNFPNPNVISSRYRSLLYTVIIQHLQRRSHNQTTAIHCEAYVCELLFCTVTDNTLRNVAKHKRSFQVSEYSDQHPSASSANDGDGQTCAASKPETNPWWSVDLGGPTLVFMVKLTNSGHDTGKT